MAPVHVAALLAHPQVRAAIERSLAARGVRGDTAIVHVNPREEAMLRMLGGSGTINPRTGLRQFDDEGSKAGGGTSGDTGVSGGGNSGLGGGVGGNNQGWEGPSGGGVLGGIGRAIGGVGSALGEGIGGIAGIGGFLDRAAGNFGQGWGSEGVAGGYGGAGNQTGAGYGGGGVGGGGLSGGHSGQNYISQTYGGQAGGGGGGYRPPLPPPPNISNLPPAVPVTLDPMMSDTATTNLAGSRFGALPSWATMPYQIGTAPSSYPTPGVNAGIGAPGYAGNPLPGQGGGGVPGTGGGGGGGSSNLTGQDALRAAAGITGEGYQGTWQDAFNQANHNRMAQAFGQQAGPTSTMALLQQWIGGQQGGQQGGQPPQGPPAMPGQLRVPQGMNRQQPGQGLLGGTPQGPDMPVAPGAGGAGLTTPAQRLALLAAMQRGTPGANRW